MLKNWTLDVQCPIHLCFLPTSLTFGVFTIDPFKSAHIFIMNNFPV